MLMSDSLGGTAKTLMFVNVSPTDSNLDETQTSLQVHPLHCCCFEWCLAQCMQHNNPLCHPNAYAPVAVQYVSLILMLHVHAVCDPGAHYQERCVTQRGQQGRHQTEAAGAECLMLHARGHRQHMAAASCCRLQWNTPDDTCASWMQVEYWKEQAGLSPDQRLRVELQVVCGQTPRHNQPILRLLPADLCLSSEMLPSHGLLPAAGY
jgi:hypothetical protein